MNASDLYARTQNLKNTGPLECHWCGSACSDFNRADFVPRQQQDIGIRIDPLAKRPGSYFCCWGCWAWNRKRLGISFLTKGFKDGQTPPNHSWYFTEKGAWALSPWDGPKIYEELLKPPLRFVLTLLSNGPIQSGILACPGIRNHLQLAICNDLTEIKGDTPLHFTLNNIVHWYTVHDLENGAAEPGTQVLLRTLGPIPKELKKVEKPKETRGRHTFGPPVEPPNRKTITSK